MTAYDVLMNTLVWKRPETRVIAVQIDQPQEWRAQAEQVIADFNAVPVVEVYVYPSKEAEQYSGWIARVLARGGVITEVETNNDPELRRAVFDALH